MEWVVMRQRESDDTWNTIFVNIEADTAWEAIEKTVLDTNRNRYGEDAEGRWVAFPNEYFKSYKASITKIANVLLEGPEELV